MKTLLAALALLLATVTADEAQAEVTPVPFTCNLDNIAATLTICQVAPGDGLTLYVTGVHAASTTGTTGTMAIRSATALAKGGAANCATATTGVLPAGVTRTVSLPINTAAPFQWSFPSGVRITPGHDLCVIGAATNTTTISISGFIAP